MIRLKLAQEISKLSPQTTFLKASTLQTLDAEQITQKTALYKINPGKNPKTYLAADWLKQGRRNGSRTMRMATAWCPQSKRNVRKKW